MIEHLIKIKNLILKDKRLAILIIAFLGLFLVLISNKNSTKQQVTTTGYEYISELELRLENIVSSIEGAGECDVMINVISSSESVYVTENKKSVDNSDGVIKSESEDSVITMSDSSGNEYALMTKEIMPEICGVMVVCDGGKSSTVKNDVIVAVSTVLGIGSNNVCVIAKAN